MRRIIEAKEFAHIRKAVGDVKSCTSAVPSSLTSLLCDDDRIAEPQDAAQSRSAASSKTRRYGQASKNSKTAITETSHERSTLSASTRARFATEIANTALKTLTQAVRESSEKNLPHGETRGPSSFSSKDTYAQSTPDQNLSHVARCAQIAFESLFHLKSSGLSQEINQVEAGLSSLVGKLLSLSLASQAAEALRELFRHIIENSEWPQADIGSEVTLEIFVKTLSANPLHRHGQGAQVVISSQLHSLRLLVLYGHQDLEKVLDHVRPNEGSGLLDGILQAFERGLLAGREASRHLMSLTRGLSDLVQIQDTGKHDAAQHIGAAKLVYVLASKLVILEAQLRARLICSNSLDAKKDVIRPLIRAIKFFARSGTPVTPAQHDTIALYVRRPLDVVEVRLESQSDGKIDEEVTALQNILSNLPKRCEGQLGFEKADYSRCDNPGYLLFDGKRVGALARHTVSRLKTTDDIDQENSMLLIRLAELLTHPGHLDLEDADETLLSLSTIRRLSFQAIRRHLPSTKHPDLSPDVTLMNGYFHFLTTVPHFLSWYLGSAHNAVKGAVGVANALQRRAEMVNRVTRPTVDALIILSKIFRPGTRAWLQTYKSAVNDVFSILSKLEHCAQHGILEHVDERLEEAHIQMSDCLASIFVARQSFKEQSDHDTQILRMSVSCLEHRPDSEKQTGKFCSKIERLVRELLAASRYQDALDHLRRAIDFISKLEQEKFLEKSATHAKINIGDDGPFHERLGKDLPRLIKRHIRLSSLTNDRDVFWYPPEESVLENEIFAQAVIEYQLLEAIRLIRSDPKAEHAVLTGCLALIDHRISKIYSLKRKFKLLDSVLHILTLCEPSVRHEALQRCERLLSQPEDVTNFKDMDHEQLFWVANCRLMVAYILGHSSRKNFRTATAILVQSVSKITHQPIWWNSEWALHYLDRLEALSEYTYIHGFIWERCVFLELQVRLCSASDANRGSRRETVICELIEALLSRGQFDCAHSLLETLMRESSSVKSLVTRVRPRATILKYVFLMRSGALELASNLLSECVQIIKHAEATLTSKTLDLNSRVELCETVGFFLGVWGELRLRQGDMTSAIICFKSGLRRLFGLLNILRKKRHAPQDEANETELVGMPQVTACSIDSRCDDAENRGRTKNRSIQISRLTIRALDIMLMLASCLIDLGQASEARFCIQQAADLAQGLESASWNEKVGLLQNYIGVLMRSSSSILDTADDLIDSDLFSADITSVEIAFELSREYGDVRAWDSAAAILSKLQSLDWDFSLLDVIHSSLGADCLHRELGGLSIQGQSRQPRSKNTTVGQLRQKSRRHESQAPSAIKTADRLLRQWPVPQILLENAGLACAKGDLSTARSALAQVTVNDLNGKEISRYNEVSARILLNSTVDQLSTNPVFNVLQETPHSVPNFAQHEDTGVAFEMTNNKRRGRSKTKTEVESQAESPLDDILHTTFTLCQTALTAGQMSHSTHRLHRLANQMSNAAILASTISSQDPSFSSRSAAFGLELGRIIAWQKSLGLRTAEKYLSSKGADPTVSDILDRSQTEDTCAKLSSFQEDFVNILPPRWIAISLSLTSDETSLQICRMQCHQDPFILSIPMDRHREEEEEGEHGLSYQRCRTELFEIIESANQSAHNAGLDAARLSKSQWWKSRKDLDQRMRDLLVSVDEIWLGGFRGIFTKSHAHKLDMLHFAEAFDGILSKHLPSRRMNSKSQKQRHLSLHLQVLELFVNLGSPNVDGSFEDLVLDLLSFVVDILQFRGECNAYDEIDFDAMTIDTIEALKHHHTKSDADPQTMQGSHTILILDKHLHHFPWESLPCMEGLSVSRLPSLYAMRELLARFGGENSFDQSSGRLVVDCTKGAYVLNPAGDLFNTEMTLSGDLSKLSSWKGLVHKEPCEIEIENLLSTSDIYLYFGHGSGAQYIRNKTIRSLESCAVALLMGCGSVSVTEAGQLESYGVPLTYLQAGAPAVVGTLWDVTDKDIDRFSIKVLTDWGLFDRETYGSTNADRTTKRAKVTRQQDPKTSAKAQDVTLSEAVRGARDACLMRYLNGAAPVVYGIPVCLK